MNHLHHHLVDRKLMRFAAIGTANTILGMGIMFGMYNWLGCGYWVSTAANYLITSVISFFANKYLTFHNHQKSIRQAFRFLLSSSAVVVLPQHRWYISLSTGHTALIWVLLFLPKQQLLQLVQLAFCVMTRWL